MLRAYRLTLRNFLKEMSISLNDKLLTSESSIFDLKDIISKKITVLAYVERFFQAIRNRTTNERDAVWLDHIITVLGYYRKYVGSSQQWTDPTFSIPIQRESMLKSESYNFIKAYRGSYRAFAYLDFEWSNLSSGEKAFLNLFARLYTRAEGQPFGRNVQLSSNVLLLIDEGELYFHPEWQRKFIDTLIRYLSVIYAKRRKIQIILTSHSPFLLSDLPGSHVIYLERGSEGTTTVTDGYEMRKRTFAANIHDMFTIGFFMSSTIGEFAKKKINGVIHRLREFEEASKKENNGEPLQEKDITPLLSIIQLIGEPILYGRLLHLYNSLLPDRKLEEHAQRQLDYWTKEVNRYKQEQGKRHD